MGAGVLDRFRLDGKVAVVTGGSRGLGRVIAAALASAGADVALSSRELESAERAAEVIRKTTGRKTLAMAADVTLGHDVDELIGAVMSTLGRIDILVNNAGVNIRGPIEELSEDDWDTVVDTNLKGPWLCCRAVGPGDEGSEVGPGDQRFEHAGRDFDAGPYAIRLEQRRIDSAHQDACSRMGEGRHQRQRRCARAHSRPRSTRRFSPTRQHALRWRRTCPSPAGATRSSWDRRPYSSRRTPRAS